MPYLWALQGIWSYQIRQSYANRCKIFETKQDTLRLVEVAIWWPWEGAVALKLCDSLFFYTKHKNRTSKSAAFAVKYIYATK